MTAQDNVLLRVKGLVKYFPVKKGVFRRTVGWVKAVDHVDLFIPQGRPWGSSGSRGAGRPPAAGPSSA